MYNYIRTSLKTAQPFISSACSAPKRTESIKTLIMFQVARNAENEHIFGERNEEVHRKRTTKQRNIISCIDGYKNPYMFLHRVDSLPE